MSQWIDSVNAAVTHMNAMELEPALELLDRVCVASRQDSAPDDALAPLAFANAFYLKGLLLNRQEQHEGAFDAHRECIERFVLAEDPRARQPVAHCLDGVIIKEALEHLPGLLAHLPAAHHALRLPTNIEMLGAIDVEMADATPAQRDETRAALLKVIFDDDARAGELHEKARSVIRECFDTAAPFALYLRNFDIEAQEKRLPDGTLLTMTTSDQGYVEGRAERDVLNRMPMVGIANGTNFRKDFVHAVPKLEVANAWWQTVLQILAERADIVLFDYRHASEGVTTELTRLETLGRADRTVIVVADEAARATVRTQWPGFSRVRLPDESLDVT